MRTIVVGAGVIGVTTAYFLARAGHQVTVIDRHSGPALECSQANGGFLSASHCAPWAAPGVPRMALRSVFQTDAPFRWRPDFTLRQLRWLWDMMGECNAQRFAVNRQRMLALGLYSHACLHEVEQATGITHERRRNGVLQLCHEAAQQAQVERQASGLRAQGFDAEWLSRDQTLALEPGLRASARSLAGALHIRNDGSGRCESFTRALTQWLQRRGTLFQWRSQLEGFEFASPPAGGPRSLRALRVNGQRLHADAFVLATGADTAGLLSPHMTVPVYPVKGYSMTARILKPDLAPRRAVLDDRSKLAMVRFDDVVRVAGYAEVVGHDQRLDERRCSQLASSFERLYPGATDAHGASFHVGLRPMTPDGTPLIGATDIPGLFLNTGHGTYGWTLSCGSARLLADIVTGAAPALPAPDYAPGRYASGH